ncbi:MAG: hypothetical protein IJG38_07480 [Thermoguttaceae bacterium]|nr:hypothetical protein [Thermoguttaceae bacterium]MBR0238039.1 hypothetical protein [Thermoguttaceae bacterium]
MIDLILDTCVLIDIAKTDISILNLINKIAILHTITKVVEEVKSEKIDFVSHNIEIITPHAEDYFALEQSGSQALSKCDKLVYLTARRYNFICVTNDTKMINQCNELGIQTIRSLRLLLLLYENHVINYRRALFFAQKMSQVNAYITQKVLDEFRKELDIINHLP